MKLVSERRASTSAKVRSSSTTWYAVALLTAPVVMTMVLLALSSFSRAFLPGIFTTDDQASLLLVSLAVGLSAGFLLILNPLGISGANLLVFSFAFAAAVWGARLACVLPTMLQRGPA